MPPERANGVEGGSLNGCTAWMHATCLHMDVLY